MHGFLAIAAAATYTFGKWATAHPLCYYDARPTDPEMILSFCPEQEDGACCNEFEEAEVMNWYYNETIVTDDCADYFKQVVCGPCHSFSGHLFERLGSELGARDGMTTKSGFCAEFVDACEGQIEFPAYDGESYCDKHVGGSSDMTWSYPIDENVTDGFPLGLVEAFPDLSDDDLPEDLMCMHMTPDSSRWWLGGQEGQVVTMDASDPTSTSLVLDISSGMDLHVTYEEGLIDFAFNPAFSENNYFYISYTISDAEGSKNRLARFTYSGTPDDTKASVDILLTTIAKSTSIHSAGWCGFQPSDYDDPTASSHDLYWSVGDGGPQEDTDERGPDLTNLQSSIVRISVPSGTGANDIGYTNPSGNREGGRGEICANGFRNPFRCAFDRETDDLYCGDVGHIMVEEIDLVKCGSDYGWSRFEGSRCQEAAESRLGDCAGVDRSGYVFPVYEYCHFDYDSTLESEAEFTDNQDICGMRHIQGLTVIMGHVYRGQKYGDVLAGALLFADHHNGNIYYLTEQDGEWVPGTIISDGSAQVIAFSEDNIGEQYVIGQDRIPYLLPCGDLCATTCLDQALLQPTYSTLGCFTDVVGDRALGLQQAPSCGEGQDGMSPGLCASYCATIEGAVYFGVEFGYECFCGGEGENFSRHGELESNFCGITCVGTPDEFCGGFQAVEVYSFTPSTVSPTPFPVQPTPVPSTTTTPTTVPPPTPAPVEGDVTAVGCYEDSSDRVLSSRSTSSRDMTTEYCEAFCWGSLYFGTEYGMECFCGSPSTLRAAASNSCDFPCAGDSSQTCGGLFAINVYQYNNIPSLPQNYVGCFKDDFSSRVMSLQVSDLSMTNELCATNCAGFLYYGTQYGKQCFCSNTDSYTDVGETSNCDYPCAGDSSQICGGFLTLSVYMMEPDIVLISDSAA